MASSPEKRILELHLTLPPAPKPVAVYKTAIKVGNSALRLRSRPAETGQDAKSPVASAKTRRWKKEKKPRSKSAWRSSRP